MNLVTQCPQCAQVFQVSADATEHSPGQVRCGQCDHVFDAAAFAVTAPVFDASVLTDSLLTSPRVDVDALLRRQDVPVQPPAQAMTSAAPVISTAPSVHEVETVSPAVSSWSTDAVAPPVPAPAPLDDAAPMAAPTSPAPQSTVHAALHAPASASPEALWQAVLHSSPSSAPTSPARAAPPTQGRWHAALAGLLCLGLAGQALFFFKDEWSARWPTSQAVWAALCEPVGCQIHDPRRWGGIVIDSSALVRGDVAYTLNLALRNATDLPLAMTALELTLTDDQDRVLVRRVLTPQALGAPETLAAGQVWSHTFRLELTGMAAEVAGYRLVSFYP